MKRKPLLPFTLMAVWVVAGIAIFTTIGLTQTPVTSRKVLTPKDIGKSSHGDGHPYLETNETRKASINYHRSANGTMTHVQRIPTGGAGSGVFRAIYEANGPNAFEGAGSVILTSDRRFLFATNGGDNSVSSFRVGKE